jgi:predicted O-linked N-acetylglucosamine transferase (SPINDLY family)
VPVARTEDDTIQRAVATLRAGDVHAAEQLFKQVLRKQPKNAAALNLLGVVLTYLGKFAEAEKHLQLAVREQPGSDATLRNYGVVLTMLDRPAEAVQRFSEALAINPAVAETWRNRGVALNELKRPQEAIADFERAIQIDPCYAEAFCGKGNALGALSRLEEALSSFERALSLQPDLTDAWLDLGNLCARLKRYEKALAAYDRALAIKSGVAEAWLGRGNVFRILNRRPEALAAYDKALDLKPDLAGAWHGRGNVLHDLNHYDEASVAYDKAIALKPDLAEAWLGRGLTCENLNRSDEARAAYDKAIALQPDFAEAWIARGVTMMQAGRHSEALVQIDRSLSLQPGSSEAWCARGRILFEMNDLTAALAAFDKALALKPDYPECISNKVFALCFTSDGGFAEQQKTQADWWERVGAAIAERSQARHANTRDPSRRIKLGYVSADFRSHSAGLSFKPVLLNHDKCQFEITCYSTSVQEDDITKEFRRAADRWRDAAQMSDDELCAQIQADQIDILVDLSGHSKGHRLAAFARKPAPIQVTAWGYATGTGLQNVDYLFSDPVVCPSDVRHLFAETIVDLPCCISIDSLPDQVQPSPPPVLSKGHLTFGVFNRATKISADAASLWAQILHAVPGSRILLKNAAFDAASVRAGVLERFATHGVEAGRVAFLGTTSRPNHLATFNEVDISLDPFPQNGGVSTWESLQMGVPVVAKLGNSIASRVAAAILSAVGMTDWVARTTDDYSAIAVKFASMPEHLTKLRHELPARISESSAGNSAKYTKAVEAAYRKMWTDYCRSA